MAWQIWVIGFIGLNVGGWMAFDGIRALVVGDYVTPSRGDHAGQLGPWAPLVEWWGIDPRGVPMKVLYAGGGVLWLGAAVMALAVPDWGRPAVVAAALATLWYLPFGTLGSILALGLLAWAR